MSIQHIARSGKIYYLHVLPTKTGKEKYHFSTSKDGLLAQVLPEGYEIYENINGQVFLRRKTKKLIESDELALVETALEQHAEKWLYKVEIKKDSLVIYESCQNIGLGRLNSWSNLGAEKEFIKRHTHYQPVMRFILEDTDKRMFRAERWCFRGSVDGWMDIMTCPSEPLPKLVKKFIKHLGKESFFELY